MEKELKSNQDWVSRRECCSCGLGDGAPHCRTGLHVDMQSSVTKKEGRHE